MPDRTSELPCPAFTFDPVRVEITSPGTQHGRPFYVVDFVETNGGRSDIYMGLDPVEARAAAIFCADDGLLPAFDLTGAEPVEILTGTLH